MHAEFGEQVLRLDHHVDQMRDRRALVAADIAHARLKQRLGDGKDALAIEGVARPEPQGLNFLLKRSLHRRGPDDWGPTVLHTRWQP